MIQKKDNGNDMKPEPKEFLFSTEFGSLVLEEFEMLIDRLIYNESLENYEECADLMVKINSAIEQLRIFDFKEFTYTPNEQKELVDFCETFIYERIIIKRKQYNS